MVRQAFFSLPFLRYPVLGIAEELSTDRAITLMPNVFSILGFFFSCWTARAVGLQERTSHIRLRLDIQKYIQSTVHRLLCPSHFISLTFLLQSKSAFVALSVPQIRSFTLIDI